MNAVSSIPKAANAAVTWKTASQRAGLSMQKTNTLWGSVIFHLAADMYWLIAFGL